MANGPFDTSGAAGGGLPTARRFGVAKVHMKAGHLAIAAGFAVMATPAAARRPPPRRWLPPMPAPSPYGGPVAGTRAASAARFRQKITDSVTMAVYCNFWYGRGGALGGGVQARNGARADPV
jgi:hypothetical protein